MPPSSSPGRIDSRVNERPMSRTVLELEDVEVAYRVAGQGTVRAVQGVSLALHQGETLGVVGESGSGKSSLARAAMLLEPLAAGRVKVDGEDVTRLGRTALLKVRRKMQLVFQDPMASLNPRLNVHAILAEPLDIHGLHTGPSRLPRLHQLLDQVGLPRDALERYPHAFSGGQRQRIGVARALAVEPEILILDEPVSALDVSVQAQVLNLLLEVQRALSLSCVLIAHDLGVVRHMSHRVAVMYLGRVVECAPVDVLFETPRHPYTRALLASIPSLDPNVRRTRLPVLGEPPSPLRPPTGCAFHPRCPHASELCRKHAPQDQETAPGHRVACHHPVD